MTTPTLPEGMHLLSPHLVCDGAADAIDFSDGVVRPFGHVWSIATPPRAPMTESEPADAAASAPPM